MKRSLPSRLGVEIPDERNSMCRSSEAPTDTLFGHQQATFCWDRKCKWERAIGDMPEKFSRVPSVLPSNSVTLATCGYFKIIRIKFKKKTLQFLSLSSSC